MLRALEQPGWDASLSCRIRLDTALCVILRARCLLQDAGGESLAYERGVGKLVCLAQWLSPSGSKPK